MLTLDEINEILNDGGGICNECGAEMDLISIDGLDTFVCPDCGYTVDWSEYEYEHYGEWTESILSAFEGNVPPKGCIACGGPYPSCMSACSRFDD